ncbi:MAG: LamG domain-containing protein [Verrucomicrobia bacterium]|nr:LamG domain-containing protein [Verrucomicrobiota bacterium]
MKGLGSAYSVSFWFCNDRPNNVAPVTGYLFSRGPDAAQGAPGDHLGIGGTHMDHLGRLLFYNGNALGQVLVGRTIVRPGTWNHVVLVREGQKVQVYLNGQLDFAGEVDVSPAAASEELFLGGRNDNFANFSGRIDEAAVYDRALSPEEIRRLHATALNPPASAGTSNTSTQ